MAILTSSPRKGSAAYTLVITLAVSHPVMACDPAIFMGTGASYDKRISVAADCSFEDPYVERFGLEHTRNARSGGPAVDVGNGRIAQKIVSSEVCFPFEHLLVVDCNSGESTLILGAPKPEAEGSYLGGAYIEYIQPPNGPISLGPQTTVDALIATARSNELEVVEDARTFLEGTRKRDRYDIGCGCDLYYPQSPGAAD
ncbi:hypothetical protein MCELHM10_02954 [Paracoccaceae bacterium]|jgi:hypothetical protein